MNPFSYYSYDLLTGDFLTQLPLSGVSFSQQLNAPGQLTATIDLRDPRVRETNPLLGTVPNRTFIVVDYEGTIIWGGIVLPRKRGMSSSASNTSYEFDIQCSELWAYFQGRVQASDYSAPPTSGITSDMALWQATPWDASLIGAQVISDALSYSDSSPITNGNLLGGLGLRLNGEVPSGSKPAAPASDYIAENYPLTSAQMVDAIVSQLAQLGLGVGFDFGVDLAYSAGTASSPDATINLSYPRRGRTVEQSGFMVDLTAARSYSFPEDGTQTGNQIWESGGSGALDVSVNVAPLSEGYPLWERVMSRANAQSANILGLLAQQGASDLATYSYAPVTPTATIGLFNGSLPLGSFTVGDDARIFLPQVAQNGEVFDPGFPEGLDQEWRITQWKAEVKDEGDALLVLDFAQPPALEALGPAV